MIRYRSNGVNRGAAKETTFREKTSIKRTESSSQGVSLR